MNKDYFKQNKNIILSHLKINWKLILFFMIFWLVISLALLTMTLISHVQGAKTPVIGNYDLQLRITSAHGSSNSSHGEILTSISQILNWALFSDPAIVFFSIFTIVLLNKSFIKEINNSQITSWVTLPLSRNQILSSKVLYIILTNLIVFLPSYIIVLILAGISYDASQWFGYIALYGFQFMLFIILLVIIYTLISILLIEKVIVLNIVNSLIAFWILVTWIILMIYDMNPVEYQNLKYVQYVSLQSLIVCPIKFSQMDQAKSIITQINSTTTFTLTAYKYIEFNKIAISLCTLAMPFVTATSVLLNNYLFKKKDLHI